MQIPNITIFMDKKDKSEPSSLVQFVLRIGSISICFPDHSPAARLRSREQLTEIIKAATSIRDAPDVRDKLEVKPYNGSDTQIA